MSEQIHVVLQCQGKLVLVRLTGTNTYTHFVGPYIPEYDDCRDGQPELHSAFRNAYELSLCTLDVLINCPRRLRERAHKINYNDGITYDIIYLVTITSAKYDKFVIKYFQEVLKIIDATNIELAEFPTDYMILSDIDEVSGNISFETLKLFQNVLVN